MIYILVPRVQVFQETCLRSKDYFALTSILS